MDLFKILLEQLISLAGIFVRHSDKQLSLDEKLQQIALIRAEGEKDNPDLAQIELRGRHIFKKSVPPEWLLFFLKHSDRPISDLEILAKIGPIGISPDKLIKEKLINPIFHKYAGTYLQLVGSIIVIAGLACLFGESRLLILYKTSWRSAYTPAMLCMCGILFGIYLIKIGVYSDRHQKIRNFIFDKIMAQSKSGDA